MQWTGLVIARIVCLAEISWPPSILVEAQRSLSSQEDPDQISSRKDRGPTLKKRTSAVQTLHKNPIPTQKPHAIKGEEPYPNYPVPITFCHLTAMDQPAPVVGNGGPPVPVPPTGPRHDEFYKYWDRFMRVKEKSKAKGKKTIAKGIAGSDTKSTRASSISGGAERIPPTNPPVFKNGKRVGPSLEKDVEGRPGHPMVRSNTEGVISSQRATTSYDEAAASCKAKVGAIVRECRRLNQKYYDRMFNLPDKDTLLTLDSKEVPHSRKPIVGVGSVKRIEDIYEEPSFFIDGATASDVRQGTNGDCWFLAAITALSGKQELINKLCVARDEKVGVYGFVFFRDGEWISEVVDDRLALRNSSDDKNFHTEYLVTTSGDQNPLAQPLTEMSYGVSKLPQDFRDSLRKGSNALYFASCKDSNETWLPLLEKAYAKAHGDYQAIEGGFAGEGVEDLTGGIATYIASEDVLDKDKLWGELLQVNDKFLFGCGSRTGRDYDPADDEGFVRGHAYTVLEAREIDKPNNIMKYEEQAALKAGRKYPDSKRNEKVRLLKLRNPWGSQEYNGAWSDGSKEWTPEVMKELDHTFGDDGMFWIAYPDFLKFYPEIDRIRLIGDEWTVTQQWTAVRVPYTADYLDTSFALAIEKEGPVVLVLSQPDDRYFQGLVGRYSFDLHFRLYKDGEETYIVRSMESAGSARSCSAELDLEPGSYTILVKITATRYVNDKTAEEVIKLYRETRRDKLVAIGKSYDAVHSKGRLRELEETNAKEEKLEEKADDKQEKIAAREQRRKERQRERARRLRREAEAKRKKDEKVKAAKEKRAAEKEEKRKEDEERRQKAETEKKEKEAKGKAEADAKEVEAKGSEKITDSASKVAPADDEGTQAGAEKPADDKDTGSVTTASTARGLATPESTPSPSADGKDTEVVNQETSTTELAPKTGAPIEIPDLKKGADTPSGASKADMNNDEAKDDDKLANNKKDDDDVPAKEPGHDSAIDDDANSEQLSCHETEDDDTVSDCSSVADSDFSWDDAVDGSGEESTDSEVDSDDDDIFGDDPWYARCVIGLRVCSIHKNVTISVNHGIGDGPIGHETVEDGA